MNRLIIQWLSVATNIGEKIKKIKLKEGVNHLHQREKASLRLVKEAIRHAICRNKIHLLGTERLATLSCVRSVKSEGMMLLNAGTNSIIVFRPITFLRP